MNGHKCWQQFIEGEKCAVYHEFCKRIGTSKTFFYSSCVALRLNHFYYFNIYFTAFTGIESDVPTLLFLALDFWEGFWLVVRQKLPECEDQG